MDRRVRAEERLVCLGRSRLDRRVAVSPTTAAMGFPQEFRFMTRPGVGATTATVKH